MPRDLVAESVARLAALDRDRNAIAGEVCDRVSARIRADAAARTELLAHARAMAVGFDRRLYHLVTTGLVPVLGAVFAPPGRAGWSALADRLIVDGPIARLRALAADATLVIAPTHSSNLDALVIGMALRRAGLPACAYAAGEHLYRSRAIGALMGRLGGFRVERGLTSARYKVALRTYATLLLERGVHTVVFPGATRCRTNHVESTIQLGLLGAAAAAERHRARHVAIVPVTINHQVVLEAATLVAYHLAGRGHERIVGDELFVWGRLRSTARRLRDLDQRVVIRFGDPLGADGLAFAPTAPRPRADPAALSAAIVAAYRRDTVLLDTHVVASALSSLPARRLGRAEVLAAIARTAAALDDRPDLGGRWDRDRDPHALLITALAAWHSAHPERVASIDDRGDVHIEHPALLWFYQNRCD